MGINRAGGTSQRCGNLPAVSFSTPFVPNVEAPKPLSTVELVSRLRDGGMTGDSPELMRSVLGKVGYQHLAPYLELLESGSGDSEGEKSLSDVHRILLFDRKFQSIILEYTGLFELQFRAQYAQLMAEKGGAFAHRDPANFKRRDWFDSFVSAYSGEVSNQLRANNLPFVKSYERYGDVPIWQAVEAMPLGMLSKLYKNTRPKEVRHGVADSFGVPADSLSSWVRAISIARNRCAHFGALAGKRLPYLPKMIPGVTCNNTSAFYIVLVLEYLLRSHEQLFEMPDSCYGITLAQDVADLFNEFADVLPIVGFPGDWDDLIVSEPVLGIPLLVDPEDVRDGDFWFNIINGDTGELIKFGRWGARVVTPDRRGDQHG